MQSVFKASDSTNWNLSELAASEVRIILLYCTQTEAAKIMIRAEQIGLTSNKYLWLVTQSVVGNPEDNLNIRESLPTGMIGKNIVHICFTLSSHTYFSFEDFTN